MFSSYLILLLLIGAEIPCKAFHLVWSPENGEETYDLPDDSRVSDLHQQQQQGNSLVLSRSNSARSKTKTILGSNREREQDKEVLSFTDTLLKNIAKRTTFANTEEEIQKQEVDYITSDDPPGAIGIGLMRKRTEQTEHHSGGCEAKKMWISLGSDHFPRFIKSYNCTSDTCNRSFGECRPKSYSVKVLRMNSPENASLLEEGCDAHLPEKLRCDWKLIPVLVTTYCECYSDITAFGR